MTIKEIAQLAGVSISTVSKIMNQKDESISAETRERVLRIAKEYHYSPHASLNGGKTFLLGVLLRSCTASRTLEGILHAARAHGYTVLLAESKDEPENERKAVTGFCRSHVDGVLWEAAKDKSTDLSEPLRSAGIPCLTFRSADGRTAADFCMDFEKMGYFAASLLVQARHRNIACLLSPEENAEGFLDGYKKCLFDAGIPLSNGITYDRICDDLTQKIASHDVTGVVCARFSSALRLFGSLERLGIRIPEDVSLVSLKEGPEADAGWPRISVISVPHFAFGQHLCESLIGMLEQGQDIVPFKTVLPAPHPSSICAPYEQQVPGLTVVGSIHIDHYLKVDRLPVSGITSVTAGQTLYPGGKGINQAIGASKLGCRVSLIGSVGDDADANLIFSSLTEHSMESRWVYRHAGYSTGQAHVFVQADGTSTISILSGANSALTPEDVQNSARAFENSSYCLMQTELPQDTLIQAGRLAHEHGAKNILKPAACTGLNEALLRLVDIFIPNRSEIDVLCPQKSLSEQAAYFLGFGMEAVIITLGEEGCYLKTRLLETFFPAADFTSFDSTGAGDAFICALAAYLQKGYPMEKAVPIASYAAGFSVTREGVVPSLIDKNTLEAHIMRTEPKLL